MPETVSRLWRFRRSLAGGGAVAILLLGLAAAVLWQISSASVDQEMVLFNLNRRDWHVLRFTVFQAGLSVLFSILIGVVLAWALSHQRSFIGRNLLIALLSSSLVLPTLVVVLGLVSVLGRNGWLNAVLEPTTSVSIGSFIYGLSGILIAHVYLNGSFVVRSLLNRLESVPIEKHKLARSLGLSTWQRFKLVEWPAIQSSIPGLAATVFLLCFTSFAIVLTLGGSPQFNTLEVAIFEAVKLDFDLPRALDLALLQLLICALLVMLAANLRSIVSPIGVRRKPFVWPESIWTQLIQILIISVLSIGFLLPLLAVVIDGLEADFSALFAEVRFLQALGTSLSIASISAFVTLIASLLLASAMRNFVLGNRLPMTKTNLGMHAVLSFSGTVYLAVPSLVLGLGFFLMARQLPGSLNSWAWVALLSANVLMALPFALAILAPALTKTAQRYDRVCFSLGIGPFARWKLVEWPLLKQEIAYVCAVSFCLSLGDLGVIALFGSQDFATLPWYLYQKMGSYRTDDAAGIALIMLALTITVFLFLPYLFSTRSSNEGGVDAST